MEAGTGIIWNWVKAVWRTVSEDKENSTEEYEEDTVEGEEQTTTTVHLNRHGLALDLPHPVDSKDGDEGGAGGATIGVGTEGVVLPEGEASIPLPPGEEPRIGMVKKAKQEVNEAVEEGRKAARNTWDLVSGIGEASEEWKEDLESEQRKYERDGWRSDVFDLSTTRRRK
jgi:hypothetical protein